MTSAPTAARPSDRHLPPLDGLRAIAILLIILVHSVITSANSRHAIDRAWYYIVNAGWVSVDLFFVLSGFLITGILYDAKGESHFFRNFYARRVLRILPLYYGFLLVFCVLLPRLSFGGVPTPVDYTRWPLSFWLYTSNFATVAAGDVKSPELVIFWTLAVEEQFYLTWPLLVWALTRRRLIALCCGLMAVALLFRVILAFQGAGVVTLMMLTPARMDTLAAGGLVALLIRGPEAVVLSPWGRSIAFFTGLLIVGGAASTTGDLITWSPHVRAVGYTGVTIIWAVLLATVVTRPSGTFARIFSVNALQAIGRYSYGLYVFHMIVIMWIARPVISTALKLLPSATSLMPVQVVFHLAAFGVTFAIAWISWHAYEKQFLKLKVFFARRESAVLPSSRSLAPASPVDV